VKIGEGQPIPDHIRRIAGSQDAHHGGGQHLAPFGSAAGSAGGSGKIHLIQAIGDALDKSFSSCALATG
jgi:hypothetical protein